MTEKSCDERLYRVVLDKLQPPGKRLRAYIVDHKPHLRQWDELAVVAATGPENAILKWRTQQGKQA